MPNREWIMHEVTITESELAALEPDELSAEEKDILLNSGNPLYIRMASDDRAVAKAAIQEHIRSYITVVKDK